MGEARRRGTFEERRKQAIDERRRKRIMKGILEAVRYTKDFMALSDEKKYEFLQSEATRQMFSETTMSIGNIKAARVDSI